MITEISAWESRGEYCTLAGHRIFTIAAPAREDETEEPLLVVHGFPTSSYDFRTALDDLRRHRRVYLLDLLGYGLSDKPDLAYTMALQADVVAEFTSAVGLREVALLTHDMGNTVGGELLARQLEGAWPVDVTRRVVTNGSIYIEMAHLTVGQQLLLGLPDEKLAGDDLVDVGALRAALTATLSPDASGRDDDLTAHAELVVHNGGNRLMPRLIRYIEERRANEARFTGAIETHPSPLGVVWGRDDPIAVPAMVERLVAARPDAIVTMLDGVGHYPMVEAPARFTAAVATTLG
jgi:pimeloyl-ACP methyl ester carboxylesterase